MLCNLPWTARIALSMQQTVEKASIFETDLNDEWHNENQWRSEDDSSRVIPAQDLLEPQHSSCSLYISEMLDDLIQQVGNPLNWIATLSQVPGCIRSNQVEPGRTRSNQVKGTVPLTFAFILRISVVFFVLLLFMFHLLFFSNYRKEKNCLLGFARVWGQVQVSTGCHRIITRVFKSHKRDIACRK